MGKASPYGAFQQGLGLMRALPGNAGQVYRNRLFLEGLFQFLELKPEITNAAKTVAAPDPLLRGICSAMWRSGIRAARRSRFRSSRSKCPREAPPQSWAKTGRGREVWSSCFAGLTIRNREACRSAGSMCGRWLSTSCGNESPCFFKSRPTTMQRWRRILLQGTERVLRR